jgi:hypothetical protein
MAIAPLEQSTDTTTVIALSRPNGQSPLPPLPPFLPLSLPEIDAAVAVEEGTGAKVVAVAKVAMGVSRHNSGNGGGRQQRQSDVGRQ